MDHSSEMKSTQVVNQNIEDGVLDVLNNLKETISMNENNLPSYGYSGDAELQKLKNELDNKEQQNNFISNGASSSSDSEPELGANGEIEELEMPLLEHAINNLEVNGEREEFEMPELDSECSSGISSCSDSTNDSNSGNEEINEKIEEHVESVSKNDTLAINDNKDVNFALMIPGKRGCRYGTNDAFMTEEEFKKQQEENSSGNAVFDPVTGAKLLPPELKGTFKLRQSNPYEFIIPLIGRAPDWGDIPPLMPEFDPELAAQFNQQKLEENGLPEDSMTFEEYIKKKQARTPEEVKADDDKKELRARRYAKYILFQTEKICLQMQSDEPNENKIIKYFTRFLLLPVSPLDMIYVPQFVHTVMYLRGCPEFSKRVRDIANDAFDKIHVMFPIPEGYNFETVYTNEVEKCLPVDWDKMQDYTLWYDWPYEDSESEEEDSESENEDSEEEEVDSGNEDEEVDSGNEDEEVNSGNDDEEGNSGNEDEEGNSDKENEDVNTRNENDSRDNADE